MPDSIEESRPVDPGTSEPLEPKSQPGYYPEFHTMSQMEFWDDATRKVIVARVERVPPIRFFSPEEARLMTAVCDRILPQDDRDDAHRIPIVNAIDERLYENRLDGYRYEDMPPDQEAHRLGLKGIDQWRGTCLESHFLISALSNKKAFWKPCMMAIPPPLMTSGSKWM